MLPLAFLGRHLLRGSRARQMASISDCKKSLRCAFSAYSPLATSFRFTKVTGTDFQPSFLQAASRLSPAINLPSGRTTIGCSKPTSSMLAARELISPRFFLKRFRTLILLISVFGISLPPSVSRRTRMLKSTMSLIALIPTDIVSAIKRGDKQECKTPFLQWFAKLPAPLGATCPPRCCLFFRCHQ
jgi:hypothetical protein